MKFEGQLTAEDHRDFLRMVGQTVGEKGRLYLLYLILLAVSLSTLYAIGTMFFALAEVSLSGAAAKLLDEPIHLIPVIVGLGLLPVAFVWLRWVFGLLLRLPKSLKADSIDDAALRDGLNIGAVHFDAEDDGFLVTMSHDQDRFHWSAFRAVRSTERCLYLMLDQRTGVIVPKRAFPDARAVDAFQSFVRQRLQVAP